MNTPPKPVAAVAPATASAPSGAFKPEVHRRLADIPAQRRSANGDSPQAGSDARRMFIGRDITMSGDIGSCDQLLVEGVIEAKLRESRHLEVTDTGSFKGAAEVEEADISGRFEGELIVHGRLRVRATGRIDGRIQYGELEVESGGQLVGDIHTAPPAATPARQPAAPVDASRLAGFPSVPPASAAGRAAGQDTAATTP